MLRHILMMFVMVCSFSCVAADATQNSKPTEKVAVNKNFIEGKHYKKLENPLPASMGPVVEFMYFGCKSCYQLVPEVANWSYTTGIGVTVVPAHSDTTMLDEARMLHTFDQLGVMDTMYELGYVIFQTEKVNLQGEARVNSFLERHKIDKEKFWATWKSDSVSQKLKQSAALTKQAQISKTPTFIVNGVYRVDVESLKSVEELFELLSYLVAKKPSTAPALLKKAA